MGLDQRIDGLLAGHEDTAERPDRGEEPEGDRAEPGRGHEGEHAHHQEH